MTRGKVELQRIADDRGRQVMFAKRKQSLFKKAMELSVLCDCDVGLIVFGPGSPGTSAGPSPRTVLYQYSSVDMDELLERYASAVVEPHERRQNGELLHHYYEFPLDQDDGDMVRDAQPLSADAAATMAAVDSIICGSAADGGAGQEARHRTGQLRGQHGASPGLASLPPGLAATPSGAGSGPAFGSLPASLRRLPMMGGGRLGPAVPLEGIRAAGFLDKRNYPVSPRSEKAFEEITAEFDKLSELRSQRTNSQKTLPTGLQPMSMHHQALHHHSQHQSSAGGAAKRFKPLSILVPDNQGQPILNATPFSTSGSLGLAMQHLAGSGPSPQPMSNMQPTNGMHLGHAQAHLQGQSLVGQSAQAGLPPRPGQAPSRGGASAAGSRQGFGAMQISPTIARDAMGIAAQHGAGVVGSGGAAAPSGTGGSFGAHSHNHQQMSSGAGPMDTDGQDLPSSSMGGTGVSAFAFDRRGGTSDGDLGLPWNMRTSLDGSAANLLSMPSPPPHGQTFFGLLAGEGSSLGVRSSSHGMLGLLGMERGTSLGLGGGSLAMGLESPGGPMGLDMALRGLAPMDVLDWPSSSPRSNTSDAQGAGAGGFSSDDGEGGTILDGLIVQGTSLAKLPPEVREAAIGISPESSSADAGPPRLRGSTPPPAAGPELATARDGEAAGQPAAAGTASCAFSGATGAAAAAADPQRPSAGPSEDGRAGAPGEPDPAESGSAAGNPGASGATGALRRQGSSTEHEMFAAAADGLTSELSFNEMPGGVAAAAAAAMAVAQQQQGQHAQGAGRHGEEGVANGLQVVGHAIALPGGNTGADGSGAGKAEPTTATGSSG